MKLSSLLCAFSLCLVSFAIADDQRPQTLKSVDDSRVAAFVAADGAKLKDLLSDELRYAHASGAVDSKASLLEALATGKTKYLSFEYAERSFSFPAPHVALMTGRAHVQVGKAEAPTKMELAFLSVWREEDGHWRFLAWQSCKLPEPAK